MEKRVNKLQTCSLRTRNFKFIGNVLEIILSLLLVFLPIIDRVNLLFSYLPTYLSYFVTCSI